MLTLFLPSESGCKQLSEHWYQVRETDTLALALYERHYSCHQYKDGRVRDRFVGIGQKLVLLTAEGDALFAWRKFMRPAMDGQVGVNCMVFRNEGPIRSSLLIEEADELAWQKWPNERLYTYVSASKVKSVNPGYCFKKAGWNLVRRQDGTPLLTKCKGLLILEKFPPSN